MSNNRRCLTRGFAYLVGSMLAGTVSAQALAATSLDVDNSSGGSVEAAADARDGNAAQGAQDDADILVTGQRQITSAGALGDLTPMSTPFSTTAVSSAQIEDLQPVSLYGVFAGAAAVTRQAAGEFNAWSSYLTIRGLPIASTSGSIRMNGVPNNLFGVTLPSEFVDEVQLLKGATGFMYGFAAPGGIVNYVTKSPTSQRTLAFDVGFRSDGLFQGHADYGDRIAALGDMGFRINVLHQEGDASQGTFVRRDAAALALDTELTPNLRWTVDALYQRTRLRKPTPIFYLPNYTSTTLPEFDSNWINPQPNSSYDLSSFWDVSTDLSWRFAPKWDVRLNFGKSRNRHTLSLDYIYLMNSTGLYQDRTYDSLYVYDFTTAQLKIAGQVNTGPFEHNLVMGANYQENSSDIGYNYFVQSYVARGSRYLSGTTELDYVPQYNGTQATVPQSGNKQKAVFFSDTINFSDWSIIAGLRYTAFDQRTSTWSFASGPGVETRQLYSTDALTPTIAVLFKPSTHTTLYASYVESLEPGTTVGNSYANAGEQLGPIRSKQYEIGAKFTNADLNATLAFFRLDRGTGYANASNVYVQDGVARYQGIDATVDWKITPRLRALVSGLYLDKSEYLNSSVAWLVGKDLPGAYRFSGVIQLDYAPPVIEGLSFNARARYTDKTTAYQNSTRQLTLTTPSYTIFDLGVRYVSGTEPKLTYRLGVNNLLDKAYWIGGSAQYVFFGDRRTIYASISASF